MRQAVAVDEVALHYDQQPADEQVTS
jgi:hypothetical protein